MVLVLCYNAYSNEGGRGEEGQESMEAVRAEIKIEISRKEPRGKWQLWITSHQLIVPLDNINS
jgi:hypothetical protein